MSYEKRLCILKQLKKGFTADASPLTGAVYAERMGEELLITPKIVGLSPLRDGRYALAVWVGGQTYCFELKGNEPLRIPNAPPLLNGFSALICFVRGTAEPIAHGYCGGAPSDHELLLGVFSKKESKKVTPVPMPPNQVPVYPSPQVPLAPTIPVPGEDEEDISDSAVGAEEKGVDPEIDQGEENHAKYDDEAIASTDYFDGIWETLENADARSRCEGEKEATKDGCGLCADEADKVVHPFRLPALPRGGLTYFHEVAPKLKAAMEKYPRDTTLLGIFPHSEWVKTESALLGIIYAEGLPRYLCVAMKEAHEKVREHCIFVPASQFTETEGYYVLFQDADTGEYVSVESA